MTTTPQTLPQPDSASHRRPVTWLLLFVVAACLAAVAAVAILRWRLNDGLPELTEEALAAAESCWEAANLSDYRLRVRIEGRQPGDVELTVAGGEVTAMTRDGRTPTQRRTWDYWTVPAQFDTIRQDMASAEDASGGFGAPPGSKAILRAEFDPQYGYPVRYQRHVLGTPLNVEWKTEAFEPLSEITSTP